MAVPTYSEDLTDIDLAESGSTGVAINYSGGGGGAPAFGADLGMQGAGCWDRQVSSHERAVVFNQTPGAPVVATGVHIFQWGFVATPGITDTLALRGAYIVAGTATNATVQYHVEGNDTYGAAGRVGKCYPFRYNTTSNTGSVPYRTVNGSPGATPTYFGFGCTTTASAKGSNLGCDAVRYGTGAYITAGEVANPGTFDGFATQNDSINNRWGILTRIGSVYELQGRFVIGQNNAKTPTLAYFSDSDSNVQIVDTVHTETDFTQIIIDHASTEAYLTNLNLTALGTNNPGRFVVNNASSTVEVTGGTWTGIGISTLRAGCVMDGLTWRQTDQITGNGATISNCTFDRVTAGTTLIESDLTKVIGNTFISDGANHAIDIGTISTSATVSWENQLSGYASGVTGDPITEDDTTNAAILCNVAAGQKLTINVVTGSTIPSVRNTGTGTVAVVAGQVTSTITVVDIDTSTPIQNANVYVVAATGGPLTPGTVIISASNLTDVNGQVSDTRSLASNQPISGRVRRATPAFGTLYKTSSIAGTINSTSGLDLTIQMIKDE